MKVHPAYAYEKEVSSDSQRVKDWLNELNQGIGKDFEDRQGWVSAKEHYFRRRYCMEFRNPDFPWVGSSNIVLPLIDKKIDELKPAYVNLITAVKPPVTVHAIDPPSQRKVKNVELFFEWLIKTGSTGFIEEAIFGIDDCLETGRGIYETYWRYETRRTPEVLRRDRLPERLRQLVVVGNVDDANNAFVQTNGAAMALTKREFDSQEKLIRGAIQREFDLDPDEPMDQKAIDSILSWFREGAREPLQFQKRDVTINVPCIQAINPIDFLVPSYTTDLEQTERITKVVQISERTLKARALDGKFNKAAVDEYLDRRKRKGTHRNPQSAYAQAQAAIREGVSNFENDELIEMWQVCTWIAPSEGGKDQKAVLLCPADATDLQFRFGLYARDRWPFHSVPFELNKKRWYASRGVPEKLDDPDAEITEQHRAKLNRMKIACAPTFKMRPNRGINWQAWRWQPGTALPCQHPDDVTVFDIPVMNEPMEREEAILRSWADDYLGGTDFANQNALSSLSEARTATEINAVQSKARIALALRGLLFQRCFQGIYEDIFDLWHTYGDPQVYINVTGGSEPIILTKEELQGRFFFQCTGTIGDTDPQMEEQKAMNRIMVLSQVKLQGLADPKWDIDLGEAIADWMEKSDLRAMKRIMHERTPEEVKAFLDAQKAAQAQMQQQQLVAQLTGAKPPPENKAGVSNPNRKPVGVG